MKAYLVKETSVATQENPSFAGETSIAFFGKDQSLLAQCGTHAFQHFNHIGIWGKEKGYKRPSDAKRSWIYKNPENSKFWKSTVEIVEVEV